MRAAFSTSGIPDVRVLRRSATLLRFTLSDVIGSQLQQVAEHLPASQRLVLETMIDQRSHERLALLLGHGVAVVVARHVEEGPAGHERLARRGLDRPTLGIIAVSPRRIDLAPGAVPVEDDRVAELLQQGLLEGAQDRARIVSRGETLQR